MKILTWNVNGIRAAARKGFLDWLQQEKPDILCLQETKARVDQLEPELIEPKGYYSHFFSAQRPGYSGTAVYSRVKPDEITDGIQAPEFDCEGRVTGLRFGDTWVFSAYYPNSQEGGARLNYKVSFCETIQKYALKIVKKNQHIILCGDYNIAHTEIDLARPKQNEESPGYFLQEREAMSKFLNSGFIDIFRQTHSQETDHYTWWSYRGGARERNVGWRIDYTCIDPGLKDRVSKAYHLPEVMGSDHCPVGLVLK